MLTYFGTALYFGKVCLIVFVYHRMIHLFVAHSNLCIRLCLFAQESVLLWVVVLFIAAQVRQILTFQLNIVFTVFDSFSMVIKDTLRCYKDGVYEIYNILYLFNIKYGNVVSIFHSSSQFKLFLYWYQYGAITLLMYWFCISTTYDWLFEIKFRKSNI